MKYTIKGRTIYADSLPEAMKRFKAKKFGKPSHKAEAKKIQKSAKKKAKK